MPEEKQEEAKHEAMDQGMMMGGSAQMSFGGFGGAASGAGGASGKENTSQNIIQQQANRQFA